VEYTTCKICGDKIQEAGKNNDTPKDKIDAQFSTLEHIIKSDIQPNLSARQYGRIKIDAMKAVREIKRLIEEPRGK
jgi:hypothetical protein